MASQSEVEKKVARLGFRHAHSFSVTDGAGEPTGDYVLVCVKKRGCTTYCCEIDPDGKCNGLTYEEFKKWADGLPR
jgi:hypothetical protein